MGTCHVPDMLEIRGWTFNWSTRKMSDCVIILEAMDELESPSALKAEVIELWQVKVSHPQVSSRRWQEARVC